MTIAQPSNSIWFEGRAGRLARLAILSGVLVHLAGFMIFHVVTEPDIEPTLPEPFVSVASTSQAVEELVVLAALSDSEPLFLPTQWNATVMANPMARDQMSATPFDTFPPEITLGLDAFKQHGNGATTLPERPGEALLLEPALTFSTFGSDRSPAQSSQHAGPRLELYDFLNGNQLSSFAVQEDILSEMPSISWRYAEFQILVDNTGQLGEPLLITSSDNEAVDRALARYLLTRLSKEALKPGYYRVVIGP
ncbi:MAG: hypothetical protein ACQKBW_07950 [Puniceicoccales bacterium]